MTILFRCLCELSRHMGFQPEAHKLFTTKEMFGVLSSTVGGVVGERGEI